jgi:hypothetical protein
LHLVWILCCWWHILPWLHLLWVYLNCVDSLSCHHRP